MKIHINTLNTASIKFPVLMQHKYINENENIIVLFTNESTGTVVYIGNIKDTVYNIGYHSTNWDTCTDTNNWTQFMGELTMKND